MSNAVKTPGEPESAASREAFYYEPPTKLSKRFLVALASLQLSQAVAAVGLVLVSWPITIAQLEPANKVLYLSFITGLYALVHVVGMPIAGAFSDRCTSRFGMRKPFIVVGVAVSVIGLLIMGMANNILMLIIGALFQALGNATVMGGTSALVPDQVPVEHRGKAQGLITTMIALSGVVASVVLPLFIGNQFLMFGVPAAIKLGTAGIVLCVLRDRRLDIADQQGTLTARNLLAEFKINPRTVPDYSWVWIGKLIVVLGTVLTTTYGVYFLTDKLRVPANQLPGVITITGLIGLVAAITGAVTGSIVSDRIGKRKSLVLIATVVIAAGAVLVAFAPSIPVYLVALFIMGLGSGAYGPIDGALAIDVLPGEGHNSGKFMSLIQVADQLPRSFGPMVGAGIVALGGFTALGGYSFVYLAGAAIAVAGGVLVLKVKGAR